MSEFNRKANELVGVLYGIERCLERYPDALGPRYAKDLRPMIDAFASAVSVRCSVPEAKEVFSQIKELMHIINGAATKGEHDFFPRQSDLLNHFWALESTFRESCYSKMTLVYDWQGDRPEQQH